MINLLTDDFPTSVEIDGESFEIYTDFRDYIELQQMLVDKEDDSIILHYILDLFVDKIPDDYTK